VAGYRSIGTTNVGFVSNLPPSDTNCLETIEWDYATLFPIMTTNTITQPTVGTDTALNYSPEYGFTTSPQTMYQQKDIDKNPYEIDPSCLSEIERINTDTSFYYHIGDPPVFQQSHLFPLLESCSGMFLEFLVAQMSNDGSPLVPFISYDPLQFLFEIQSNDPSHEGDY